MLQLKVMRKVTDNSTPELVPSEPDGSSDARPPNDVNIENNLSVELFTDWELKNIQNVLKGQFNVNIDVFKQLNNQFLDIYAPLIDQSQKLDVNLRLDLNKYTSNAYVINAICKENKFFNINYFICDPIARTFGSRNGFVTVYLDKRCKISIDVLMNVISAYMLVQNDIISKEFAYLHLQQSLAAYFNIRVEIENNTYNIYINNL